MAELQRHLLHHADGREFLIYGELRGRLDDAPTDAQRPDVHLRLDPLTDEWVAVSPARNKRPQTGHTPGCPLCPGGAEIPFRYDAAVFENRFPSLVPEPPDPPLAPGGPLLTASAVGRCEVVLYTPTHEGSLATLDAEEVCRVVAVWRDRSIDLWADERLESVLIFENRGEDVGATLSHPHGQIYAFGHVPPQHRARVETLLRYRHRRRRCLSCDLVEADDAAAERTVAKNDAFTVATPYAPRWPYELHVRARRHGLRRLADLERGEQLDLARALHEVVGRYDAMFEEPMSYLMVAQEAPRGAEDWHLSYEFLPPLRAPGKLKIRASVETAAGTFINDTSPEESAQQLAAVEVDPFPASEACIADVSRVSV